MNSQVIFGWILLLVFIGIIGASEIKDDDNIDFFENKLTSQETIEEDESQVFTATNLKIKQNEFLIENPTKQVDDALKQDDKMESKNELDYDDESIESEEETNLCDDEDNSNEKLLEIIQINTQEDDKQTADEIKLFQMFEFKMDILIKQLLFLKLESSKIEKISCGNRKNNYKYFSISKSDSICFNNFRMEIFASYNHQHFWNITKFSAGCCL